MSRDGERRDWHGEPGTGCARGHDPGPLELLSAYSQAYYVRCRRCRAAGVVRVAILHDDVDESLGAWQQYDDR